MNAFFEIGRDDHVVQRVAVLSVTERERLEANGYVVTGRSLDRAVWRWLLNEGSES